MQKKGNSTGSNSSRHVRTLRAVVYAIICYLLTPTLQAYANTYLLINSGDGGIYRQFKKQLSVQLNPQDNLISTNLKNFNPYINASVSEKFTAVITTGIEAAIAISRTNPHSKIIMSMLPRENYMALSKSGKIVCKPRHCRVIFLDQPVTRQLRLIKLAFPGKNNIAVITGKNSAELSRHIGHAANKLGLSIHRIRVSSEDALISALNQDLTGSDILMAVPDPQIYNRNTARAVLLATFNQHIPLFAYSRSFVRAGAVLGIYSTPGQIAHHVADLLNSPGGSKQGQFLYPKYFTIDINQRAADALNIDIPDAGYLTQRLESHEKP